MMKPVEFGYAVGRYVEKQAGGIGTGGKLIGGWLGAGAKPAAQAAGAVKTVPNPGKITVSPAEAAAGRAKMTITPQDVAARQTMPSPALPPTAPKVTISPAEAAAGRAKMTITPQEAAAASGTAANPIRLPTGGIRWSGPGRPAGF